MMTRKINKKLQERAEQRIELTEINAVDMPEWDSRSSNVISSVKFHLWLERALKEHAIPLSEARGNADIESIISKLRSAYRANKLQTFREFISLFAMLLGG